MNEATGYAAQMDNVTLADGGQPQEGTLALYQLTSEGRNHHQIKYLRALDHTEAAEYESSRALLVQMSAGSPLEALARSGGRYEDACAHYREAPSVGAFERVTISLDEFAQSLEQMAASLLNQIDETVQGHPNLQERCRSLHRQAQTIRALLEEPAASWNITRRGLECAQSQTVVLIDELLQSIIGHAEEAFLYVIDALAPALDDACLRIRKLAAEALRGVAAVMPYSAKFTTIQPIPVPLREAAYVQELRARAEVVSQDSSPEAPLPTSTPDATPPSPPSEVANAHLAGAATEPPVDPERPTDLPPTSSETPTTTIPRAVPDLASLVQQLSDGTEDFLTAWSAVIDRNELLQDQESLRSALGSVGQALVREMQAEDAASQVLTLPYPPAAGDLVEVDVNSAAGAAALAALGRISLVQRLLRTGQMVSELRTFEWRDNKLVKLTYDPSVVQTCMDLAFALSTCVHDGQRATDRDWVNLALSTFRSGMPEASVLYSLLAFQSRGTNHILIPMARALLDLEGNSIGSLSRACYVPIAETMVRSLVNQGGVRHG